MHLHTQWSACYSLCNQLSKSMAWCISWSTPSLPWNACARLLRLSLICLTHCFTCLGCPYLSLGLCSTLTADPCQPQGPEGDVSTLQDAKGQAPAWIPPANVLKYLHVPGHSPGQMSLLHVPSKSLLPADAFTHKPVLELPPMGVTLSRSALDVKNIVKVVQFETAYPAHDNARGVSYASVQSFAATL